MSKVKKLSISEGGSLLQERLINYLLRRGKKSVARKILADTLNILKQKGHKDPVSILEKAIENVKPALEVRPKRIGGSVYQIPVEVQPGRQLVLAFRWIIKGAKDRKGAPMAEKLASELDEAFNGTGTAIKKKEDTHRMAQANRAFAHYARY